jgi:hypothetical protein
MTTMTTMKKYECKICGDYGWDLVDGVCTVCLDGHEEATPVMSEKLIESEGES